jgi:putative transposase
MAEYMHQNPVRRGLVAHAEEWKWSSAGWYAGQGAGPLRIDPTMPRYIGS